MSLFKKDAATVAAYEKRNAARQTQLVSATMSFVGYFMGLGDTQEDAEQKVRDLSTECNAHLFGYVLGNTQPLIDQINASNLAHMDAAAKTFLIGELTPTV